MRLLGYLYTGKGLAEKYPEPIGRRGKGPVLVEKQAVEGCSKYVRESRPCIGVKEGRHGMVDIKLVFQVAVSFL